MKIIYNNCIPFQGFLCMNLFGILFVRDRLRDKLNDVVINHEAIHTAQMKELLYIGFYVWYVIEWLLRLVMYGFKSKKAYKNICFEKETFENEEDLEYLNNRKHYAFLRKNKNKN